jgi:hypothetical protein
MPELVLLGDSIFDNAQYVPGETPVIDQVRQRLPAGSTATLLAVDGNCVRDIERQIQRLPRSASHLFVSAGGNDALMQASILDERAGTVAIALEKVSRLLAEFRGEYSAMVKALRVLDLPLTVCTVYDAVPALGDAERMALSGFNEVIMREAIENALPMIDLRYVCDRAMDYSIISPIEPSEVGGAKIAERIVRVARTHDFETRSSMIYR